MTLTKSFNLLGASFSTSVQEAKLPLSRLRRSTNSHCKITQSMQRYSNTSISTIITTHTPFCFSSPPPPACTRRVEIQFLSAVSGPKPQRPRNQRKGTVPRERNVAGKARTSPRRRRTRDAEPAIVGREDHRWRWAGRR